jgi:hypothetical protein
MELLATKKRTTVSIIFKHLNKKIRNLHCSFRYMKIKKKKNFQHFEFHSSNNRFKDHSISKIK